MSSSRLAVTTRQPEGFNQATPLCGATHGVWSVCVVRRPAGALQWTLQWTLQCVSTGRFLQRNTHSAGDSTTFSLLLLSFYINFATLSLLCTFAAARPRSTSRPPTTHTHTNKHFSLCPHCVRHTTVWKELYQHSELC